jgi:pterin-4a-carbinolamine dehydratase
VTVSLSTHSAGGITEKDLALAAEADRLAEA